MQLLRRYSIKSTQSILDFEKSLDATLYFRVGVAKRTSLSHLKDIFAKYDIDWNATLTYHKSSGHIRLVYLKAADQATCANILLSHSAPAVEPLFPSLEQLARNRDVSKCGVFFVPITKINSCVNPIETFQSIVNKVSGRTDILVTPVMNESLLTANPRACLVELQNEEMNDLLWNSQPFEGVIYHKLNHLTVTTFIRGSESKCTFCKNAEKEGTLDLCLECMTKHENELLTFSAELDSFYFENCLKGL